MVRVTWVLFSFIIASCVPHIHRVDYRKHSFNFIQALHTHSIDVSFFPHTQTSSQTMRPLIPYLCYVYLLSSSIPIRSCYCYEMLIGERCVRQMKKYKEAKEERSVYSADSFLACLAFYLRPNRQLKYRELYKAGGPWGEILRPQHALPSDPFLACSPSISGDISESSN